MHKSYYKGCLLVIAAALLLSLQPVFAIYAYQDGANAWGVVLMRFVLPGLFFVICFKRPSSLKIIPTLLLGALFGLVSLLYYASLMYINAGLAAILLYLYPLFLYLLALYSKQETLNYRKSIALLIALLGVHLSIEITSGNSVLGILLALGAMLTCGLYIVGCRRILPADGGVTTSGWIMAGAALLFLIPLALGEVDFPNSIEGYSAGLALSVLCGLIPISLLILGIQLIQKDTDVGILCMIEPIGTLVLAWLLLAEPLQISNVFGAVLIIFSLLILMLPSKIKTVPT